MLPLLPEQRLQEKEVKREQNLTRCAHEYVTCDLVSMAPVVRETCQTVIPMLLLALPPCQTASLGSVAAHLRDYNMVNRSLKQCCAKV